MLFSLFKSWETSQVSSRLQISSNPRILFVCVLRVVLHGSLGWVRYKTEATSCLFCFDPMGPTHTTDNHTKLPSDWRVVSVKFFFVPLCVSFALNSNTITQIFVRKVVSINSSSCLYFFCSELQQIRVVLPTASRAKVLVQFKINCQEFRCSQRNIQQHYVLLSH